MQFFLYEKANFLRTVVSHAITRENTSEGLRIAGEELIRLLYEYPMVFEEEFEDEKQKNMAKEAWKFLRSKQESFGEAKENEIPTIWYLDYFEGLFSPSMCPFCMKYYYSTGCNSCPFGREKGICNEEADDIYSQIMTAIDEFDYALYRRRKVEVCDEE